MGIPPLTLTECQAAIDRARQYPPNSGRYYVVRELSEAEFSELAPSCDYNKHKPLDAFRDPRYTIDWLQSHPEDLEHGWPAVAVTAVRGTFTFMGLYIALQDVANACKLGRSSYCLHLNDPLTIVNRLESYKLELLNEGNNGNDTADKGGMQSSDRPSE